MPALNHNYYAILEIETNADQETIETAYRRLALLFHPDLNQSASATLRMQEINEAYSTLRHSDKRGKYDREHGIAQTVQNVPDMRAVESASVQNQKKWQYIPPPPPEPEPRPSAVEEQAVLFYLEHSSYALRIQDVEGILMMQPISPSSRYPSFAEGVILARGRETVVIDLRRYFGMEQQPVTRQTRIILGNVGGVKMGLIVDAVENYITIPGEDIDPSPSIAQGQRVPFIRGIVRQGFQLIILLDLPALFTAEELMLIRGG